MTMSKNEMVDIIKAELKEQWILWTMNKENHYSYLSMLARDMGISDWGENDKMSA